MTILEILAAIAALPIAVLVINTLTPARKKPAIPPIDSNGW